MLYENQWESAYAIKEWWSKNTSDVNNPSGTSLSNSPIKFPHARIKQST